MIIIPDVHGRKFWRDAIQHKEDGEKVIFLGDYMEPYTSLEQITSDDSYNELVDIIEYKKANSDDVILLIGNHDLACIDKNMISCRHDYNNEKRNKEIFTKNADLFQIAYQEKIGKKEYLFTHAGVHKDWMAYVTQVFPYDQEKTMADNLNNYYKNNYNKFRNLLGIYSNYRGWSGEKYGSCVWADVNEWIHWNNSADYGIFQVFGHTLSEEPVLTEHFAMLDSREGFRLTEDNKFYKISKKETNDD